MMTRNLSVREIISDDIPLIADYWTSADPDFLASMGVDLSKIPSKKSFERMLMEQLEANYPEKKSYAIIWLVDGIPAGHSNINKIIFGKDASMHLHLWHSIHRRKGMGKKFVHMTLPHYFKNFQLEKIYCEPYALNPAPNHTLRKAGFIFVKKYLTMPGSINFEQEVMRWELSRATFEKMDLI